MKSYFIYFALIFSISIFSQNIKKTYHDNGKLKSVETHSNNVADGPFKTYWETGEIMEEGNFKTILVDGESKKLRTGSYIGYLPDGTIVFKGSFAIKDKKSLEIG